MSRPSAGTWCEECWKAGHRCQAMVFLGETTANPQPLCLDCADGVPCVASSRPAGTTVAESTRASAADVERAMNAAKTRGGDMTGKALSLELQEKLRAEIGWPASRLAKKYGVTEATIYNYRRKWNARADPKLAANAHSIRPAEQVQPATDALVLDRVATPVPQPSIVLNLTLTSDQAESLFASLSPAHKQTALAAAIQALIGEAR